MGSSLPAVTNDGDLEVTELANCAAKPGGKHVKSGLLKDIQIGIQMGKMVVSYVIPR